MNGGLLYEEFKGDARSGKGVGVKRGNGEDTGK